MPTSEKISRKNQQYVQHDRGIERKINGHLIKIGNRQPYYLDLLKKKQK
jgi:hypothetical protein